MSECAFLTTIRLPFPLIVGGKGRYALTRTNYPDWET